MHERCQVGGMVLLSLLLTSGIWGPQSSGASQNGRGRGGADGAPPPARIQSAVSGSELASAGSAAVGSGPTAGGDVALPIEPELARRLAQADPEETVRVIVHLRERTDLDRATLSGSKVEEARARLVSHMQATAEQSQASLLAFLEAGRAAGKVVSHRSFWITNAVAARATPTVVRALARHTSVAAIRLDRWRQWVPAALDDAAPSGRDTSRSAAVRQLSSPSVQTVEWNVERVRADEVWPALHISGTGAIVAGMDTGVDWLHPALQASYLGFNPHGPSNHTYSWHDATEGGALYPVDGHGHGSHTMGTIVGQDGIGVAPGARWVAVKVLDNQGFGYDSWIHAGFQWLVAPGGDPSKAPDVVNCSWGNSNGHLVTFQDDLRAVRAAGIMPVFSSGNDGPGEGTVSSPASLPQAFAVGAVDESDEVANFSGRGPSPWGEIRPHVAAPGVHILSSTPGGAHASMDGTSTAAPHASGIVALLRSVSPTLSISRTAYVITSTAVPQGAEVPNNDSGWGRVDAFAAVSVLAHHGFIVGTVKDAESGLPVAGARVRADSHGDQQRGEARTDEEGAFELALSPATYDLTASAFGYQSATVFGISIVTGTTTSQNLSLMPLPRGSLRVEVSEASSGRPITASLSVLDTPHEMTIDTYTFELPEGTYTVRARRLGYRVVTTTTPVLAGEVSTATLLLPAGPSILLVDSGGWYYESQIGYFRQALDDTAYAYREWPIRHLPGDLPSPLDVTPYDILVWSAPRDAPGYIGASDVITRYLEGGGRLFLAGQDVGFWDGGGSGVHWSPYYRDYLKTRFVDDNASSRVLRAVEGDLFAGTTITIAGPGGADNQDYPDVVSVADPDAAAPILTYQGGGCGGVRVGTCLDYRVVYLPFGFEAISDRARRQDVMQRSLDWLIAPPPRAELELLPGSQLGIGAPGSLVTHTVRVRQLGWSEISDRVGLELDGGSWRTEMSHQSLTLAPCVSSTVMISVTVPITASTDLRDVVTLTARSSLSPTMAVSTSLVTKAPAPVLLVDDDRWYDQQMTYGHAAEDAGLAYDLWPGMLPIAGPHPPGPPLQTLELYPVVVWWTGYDWYAPLTAGEIGALEAYLEGGGRLFLSSQDFLYYHDDKPFSRDYLGVLTYTEDITPTQVGGVAENLVGEGLETWSLDFPTGYKNWSDGLTPAPGTGVPFRDQGQRAVALTHRADEHAALFLAFPFEALPAAKQSTVMERVVGWLSWMGLSTFEVDPRSVTAGDTVTYTIALRNDAATSVTASVTNTLPTELALDAQTLAGPATYDPVNGRLSWKGSVPPGDAVTSAYRATVLTGTTEAGPILNSARVRWDDHGIGFTRTARLRLDAPDLSESALDCVPPVSRPGGLIVCTLGVANTGSAVADPATALVRLPESLTPLSDSASAADGTLGWADDSGEWTGRVAPGEMVQVDLQLRAPPDPVPKTLYIVALIDDGFGGRWERPGWLEIHPWSAYLPWVMRDE